MTDKLVSFLMFKRRYFVLIPQNQCDSAGLLIFRGIAELIKNTKNYVLFQEYVLPFDFLWEKE